MITVRSEAESKLKEMLETIKPYKSSWRALTYNFSLLKKHIPIDDLHKLAFGVINNELAEKDGSIFIMADDDIVALCKSVTKKNFDEITAEIQYHIPEEVRLKLEIPFSLMYDLGVSWEDLYEISRDRVNITRAQLETHGSVSVTRTTDSGAGLGAQAGADKHILSRRMERTRNHVLLVDDDPLSLFLAKKALEPDCVVFTAEDGKSARDAYLKYAPDVVFLDIGLPDMSGHDVLKNILNEDRTAYVVMLSANSSRHDIMRAMQFGAKGFVGKPFSKAKLHQYVSQSPTFHPASP